MFKELFKETQKIGEADINGLNEAHTWLSDLIKVVHGEMRAIAAKYEKEVVPDSYSPSEPDTSKFKAFSLGKVVYQANAEETSGYGASPTVGKIKIGSGLENRSEITAEVRDAVKKLVDEVNSRISPSFQERVKFAFGGEDGTAYSSAFVALKLMTDKGYFTSVRASKYLEESHNNSKGEKPMFKDLLKETEKIGKKDIKESKINEDAESAFDSMIQPIVQKYGLTFSNSYPEAEFESDGDYFMVLTVEGKATDILRFLDDPNIDVQFNDNSDERIAALRGDLASAGNGLVGGVDIGIYFQYDMEDEDDEDYDESVVKEEDGLVGGKRHWSEGGRGVEPGEIQKAEKAILAYPQDLQALLKSNISFVITGYAGKKAEKMIQALEGLGYTREMVSGGHSYDFKMTKPGYPDIAGNLRSSDSRGEVLLHIA